MIRAPFNFIRLSDQVFFPEWADKISHDVPFLDWFSGVISLDITAASPVFVRNGHTQEDANNNGNDRYKSFSRINEKYFIPGTSIKGAVRNVLSIISNGKIRVDKNLKFAQREWDNRILYPLKGQQNNFLCGWLKWDKEKGYYIENHGKPYRIAHTRLDEYFHLQGVGGGNLFASKFSSESGFDLNSECEYEGCSYDPKTATYKYALVDNIELYDLNFEIDDEYANEYKPNRVKVVEEESDDSFKGCVVFTGQPSQWVFPRPKTLDPTAGKFYDFVFRNDVDQSQKFAISDEDFHKYESMYEDNCDWKRWKSKIYSKGIPVFFRLENKKIKDWGLAFLYKLPYERTPFETLPSNHRSSKLDLADCIFGTVSKDFSLKGRVSFGHAFCTNEHPQVNSNVRLVLSSPKASYYPIYIAQKVRNGRVDRYETYNDGTIAGWKRYPIRNEVWGTATGSDLLDTVLYPLDTNSHFTSKVRFFNLNTFELGALLSALTFHDNEKDAYFQIGQGKPYGYGKVKIKVQLNCLEGKFIQLFKDVDALKALMAYYESQMQSKNFPLQVSLSELLPMASSSVSGHNFEYMTMSNVRANNEFLQEKTRGNYLRPFTETCSAAFHPLYNQYASVVNNLKNQITDLYNKQQEDRKIRILEEERLKQQEEIKKLEQARIEKEQKQREVDSLKQKGNELKQKQDYQQALTFFEEAYSIDKTLLELKQLIDECRSNLNKQQRPINECILNKISSIPAYTNNISKWLKLNNRDLSDDEKQQILEHVLDAYNKLNKSDKKKWKNSLKDLNKLLGMDISSQFKD